MVFTSCFVDVKHARNRDIRIYQTGVLIFVNNAPIQWYSKKQNNVVKQVIKLVLKTATELVKALWYKLRVFGIPI